MKEMTSLERCMAVLNGNIPDKLPVVPQCFMLAVETAGMKISDVNKNGRKMAEAHFISQEKYGYDGCVIDFDDATIADRSNGMGIGVNRRLGCSDADSSVSIPIFYT